MKLGWMLVKKGDFENGIRYLKKANSLSPNNSDVLLKLGGGYLFMDNADKMNNAISYFTKSMQCDKS
jgi:hypothetical protein